MCNLGLSPFCTVQFGPVPKLHNMQIMCIGLVFVSLYNYAAAMLRALGDSVFALFNGIIEVIGRLTVPIGLTSIAAIGLWGIWWSVGIVWSLSGSTAWMRYMYYKKKLAR